MAKDVFTSWSDLVTELKNQITRSINSNQFREKSYTSPDGETVTFITPQQMQHYLKIIQSEAEAETSELKKHRPMQIRMGKWGR